MGLPMAHRLLQAGFPLAVFNRTRDKLRPLADAGAIIVDEPAELARRSDFVISCLADDVAVELVYFGPDGLIDGANPGAILIDTSTVLPHTAHLIEEAAIAKGALYVDAALTGSVPQATDGTLTVLLAGEEHIVAQVRPIVSVLASNLVYVGETPSAKMMKIVVNLLLGVGMQAIAEALTLGERAGLDRNVLIDVLARSPVIAPVFKSKLENARKDEYPTAFPIELMLKDLNLIFRRSTQLNVPLPVTAAAQQVFIEQAGEGKDQDYSTVVAHMRRLAGMD